MQTYSFEETKHNIADQLNNIGVTPDQLRQAVERGQSMRSMATENHPPNAAGTFAFFETVRSLRDTLLPGGWEQENVKNLSLTVNRSLNIAIAVAGGNKETGLHDGRPKTRNPKGNQTRLFVDTNQLDLFYSVDSTNNTDADSFQTWVLMYYSDIQKNEVRYELSLPISMDIDARISGWKLRLIFPPVSQNTTYEITSDPEFNPDPEIFITKKNKEQ